MKSVKKSVVTVILVAMIMAVISLGSVNAVSTIPDLSIGGDTTSGTTTDGTTTGGTTTDGTTTGGTTNKPSTTLNQAQSGSNYADTDLPKTGITEDYAIFALIAVCGISAIFAYTRIRK